jgi:hypothetical protein
MSKAIKIGNTTIITVANMEKETLSLAKKAATIDALIHRLGVSGLYHAQNSGDTRSLFKVIEAMPKSSRLKAFKQWLINFGAFEVDDKGNLLMTDDKLHLKKGRTDDDWNVVGAEADPFWSHTKEKDPVAPDWDKMVAAFVKRAGGIEGIDTESLASVLATFKPAANEVEVEQAA